MFVRPVLITFGKLLPGTQQYSVDITTPFGMSRRHTVEVDQAGHARTVL
jgi:hypothetical protein